MSRPVDSVVRFGKGTTKFLIVIIWPPVWLSLLAEVDEHLDYTVLVMVTSLVSGQVSILTVKSLRERERER